jgi:NADPH-dependent 2,4-dienoyl-CoA reductase/sulfur reductase-like enzyme
VPLARAFGDDMGGRFESQHARNGVEVYCDNAISSIEVSGGRARPTCVTVPCSLPTSWSPGVGSAPAIDWLRGSGLTLTDGVVCDAYLRMSAPDVVAAGDNARWSNPLFDEGLRIEHCTNAVEQGNYAARSSQCPRTSGGTGCATTCPKM